MRDSGMLGRVADEPLLIGERVVEHTRAVGLGNRGVLFLLRFLPLQPYRAIYQLGDLAISVLPALVLRCLRVIHQTAQVVDDDAGCHATHDQLGG